MLLRTFAHRFREIAASAAGEVGQMDEIDFTNENSQTEHNNNFVKFRLFHVEKVECDRSVRYPHPRSGHRIVANDSYVYLFGGFNPDVEPDDPFMANDPNWRNTSPLFQELWKFSKLTRTWSLMRADEQGDPPPTELASHAAVLLDNSRILVYGGSGATFGLQSSNKLHVADLNTNKWTMIQYNNEVEDRNIPEPMYGQAIVFDHDNEKLYVVGGTTGFEYFLDVHAFDWTAKKWTKLSGTLPPDIEVRYRHELAFWDNKLYVIGGGAGQRGHDLKTIPVFDLTTNTWSRKQTHPHVSFSGDLEFPSQRYSHDCAQLGSTIYMVGGTHVATVYNDIWSLELTTLSWQQLPCSLPEGLYFHSVAISEEGQLSVFGGVSSVERKVRNNTYLEVWVKVPQLKTLARMALIAKLGTDKSRVGQFLQKSGTSVESLQMDF